MKKKEAGKMREWVIQKEMEEEKKGWAVALAVFLVVLLLA